MASGEGSQAIPLGPEWRNWQTQETQNLPPVTRRVGSTPSSGTNPSLRSVLVPSEVVGLLDLRPAASVFESDPPSFDPLLRSVRERPLRLEPLLRSVRERPLRLEPLLRSVRERPLRLEPLLRSVRERPLRLEP